MPDLADGQWLLYYPPRGPHQGASFTFGTIDTHFDLISAPDIGLANIIGGEVSLPGEDGSRPGRDFLETGLITFEVNVDSATQEVGARHSQNLTRLSELRGVWRADALRGSAGAVASLYCNVAGHKRVMFGRPRRFQPSSTRLTRKGFTPVLMDFVLFDDRFYADPEDTHRVSFATYPSGGMTSQNLSGRLFASRDWTRPADLFVYGQYPTWGIITIHGPIKNPTVRVGEQWQVGLNVTLGADQSIVIDPRPFARYVRRNDGANMAAALTRTSPKMSDMLIPPGYHGLDLGGVDPTGTSYAEFHIRSAYAYL